MSKSNHGQSNVPMRNSRNEINVRQGSGRSTSVDPARLRRRQKNDMQKTHIEKESLEEYGLCFENGKLVSIDDGRPFRYDIYPSKDDNNRRYHSIGRLVDDFVYNILENDCHLRRIPIPFDARKSEPTGFFFASDNLSMSEYLMIIIHGMGVVRAGQWSRKLIINENLEIGSQISYIQRALSNDYAVIVTNTNLNTNESSKSIFNATQHIRGSESAEAHACYIWENFVLQSPARYICIMAHSYGGAVVLELAHRFTRDFDRRVFAVALTDSPMKAYTKHFSSNVLRMLQKRTINWVADRHLLNTELGTRDYGEIRSAGPIAHEWTSYEAFGPIFQFFNEERQKTRRHKFQ